MSSKETVIKGIKEKLDGMTGKTFEYGRNPHTIKKYEIDPARDRVYIHTDKSVYDRTFDSFNDFISMFKPVINDVGLLMGLPVRQVSGEVIASLKDVLMDNIAKIKADKSYIPQAEAIKGNVDSVIDLAKTELAYMITLGKLKISN